MTLFSTEMVSKYHPDKYADQISDAVLTAILKEDPKAHVACECMVKDNVVILGGEITTTASPNYWEIVNSVATDLGYLISEFRNYINTQSPQIQNAVDSDQDVGAGDQGMMFGYAQKGGKYFLPYGQEVAIDIISAIENDIKNNPNSIFQGDAKTQVTTDLSVTGYVKPIDTILISVCHKDGLSLDDVQTYVKNLLNQNNIPEAKKLLINPAGIWTIGGPTADCGLTGRKIVCDQYGGYAPVGGGAFSGKDPSKVDRSACYMARKIAVDLIKKYDFEDCTVQLAYAIGMSQPVSVSAIGTKADKTKIELGEEVKNTYNLTPGGIIKTLKLTELDYTKIASSNHMIHFV